MSQDNLGWDVSLSLCPETKKFSYPNVHLSLDNKSFLVPLVRDIQGTSIVENYCFLCPAFHPRESRDRQSKYWPGLWQEFELDPLSLCSGTIKGHLSLCPVGNLSTDSYSRGSTQNSVQVLIECRVYSRVQSLFFGSIYILLETLKPYLFIQHHKGHSRMETKCLVSRYFNDFKVSLLSFFSIRP